jgi:hypothetical protein
MQEALGVREQGQIETALRSVDVAPKLAALQDLLVQCGIITTKVTDESAGAV